MSRTEPVGLDHARLVEVIAAFARRATSDFSLAGLLDDLAVAAAGVLDVDGAGVTYLEGEQMTVAHVLPPFLQPVEQVQEEDQEGPCHDAARTRTWVVEEELAEHSYRWPRFAERALAAGVHAVASLPLLGREQVWGAMDLYRRAPGPFAAEQLAVARVLADVACGYVVMAHDRQVAQAAQQDAAHAATHDTLTGLPNRALLYDRLHHAVATTARSRQAMAVVFVDLDGFKQINDTHGHHAGDELLRQVAQRLAAAVRIGDTLARWGGDEFVVVCESLHAIGHPVASAGGAGSVEGGDEERSLDEHAVKVITDRLRNALEEPVHLPASLPITTLDSAPSKPGWAEAAVNPAPGPEAASVAVRIRASIGAAACVPAPGAGEREVEDLLRSADEAMYRAKRARQSGHQSEHQSEHRGSYQTGHDVVTLLLEPSATSTPGTSSASGAGDTEAHPGDDAAGGVALRGRARQ